MAGNYEVDEVMLYVMMLQDCNQHEWPEMAKNFADRDAVFIMSYSIIMLNVDLHNKQVKTPMTLKVSVVTIINI